MPKLSIIVPIYKVEDYLPRCIESILNQTFSDFELILIDDGSPDKCGEICDQYAQKDSRVQVIHQINKGVSAARNRGVGFSKGKYIGFVDPDDIIEPEMYEKLIKAAENDNAQICICNFSEQHQNSEQKYAEPIPEAVLNLNSTIDLMRIISITQISGILLVLQSLVNKIFEAEVFRNIIFYGTFGEDCDAINKIYSKNYRVCIINEPLYIYCLRKDSAIRSRKINEQVRFLDIYKERWSLYKDKEIVLGAKRLYCTSYLFFCYEYKKEDLKWSEDKKTFKRCFLELLKNKRCGYKLFVRGSIYIFNTNIFYLLEDTHRWLYSKRLK